MAASHLLSQLLLQDVERTEGRVKIRQGTSGERIPSVHDPEMRHRRKSPAKRFDGHKLGIAVDTDGQLITAVDVMAGSAKDNEDALGLVQASEAATAVKVEMAMGDAACSGTRREFLNANKKSVSSERWLAIGHGKGLEGWCGRACLHISDGSVRTALMGPFAASAKVVGSDRVRHIWLRGLAGPATS